LDLLEDFVQGFEMNNLKTDEKFQPELNQLDVLLKALRET
jgi:hypothetical protein